ncbi:CLUMA_CG015412, isoform A [Clunio marinus]|uniref:CLUMA_CG015412, isoform A n=1 Tax=Clunio marinus TaxID=568069 RepID=A0A1J1IPP8_9DIPT|nr:CLUMA_CG015412, isoform A [Clunio marinus]
MDLLDDILSSMDKNQRPALSQPDKVIQKRYQEQQKVAEKERQIINNFTVKIQNKLAAFLKDEKLATMQFEPMEKIFRSVIIETTEESNSHLYCHTFGKEDRYVIVYKNPPSELEIEARHYGDYTKWNKEIEAEYKKKKEESALAMIPTASSSEQSEGREQREQSKSKKTKLIHLECEALGTDLNRNYGMVSTELKKDTRSIEQTLNDIQQKKRLKTQHQNDNT